MDLSKTFDKVNWLFIRLLLTHVGFKVPFINLFMSCMMTMSFVFLINGLASSFFWAKRGLRQGYPLSPRLFSLVLEGHSKMLVAAKGRGDFKGASVAHALAITHLLFVDDVLIFSNGTQRDL